MKRLLFFVLVATFLTITQQVQASSAQARYQQFVLENLSELEAIGTKALGHSITLEGATLRCMGSGRVGTCMIEGDGAWPNSSTTFVITSGYPEFGACNYKDIEWTITEVNGEC